MKLDKGDSGVRTSGLRRQLVSLLVLIALLGLPGICSARGWWCAWFPFFCSEPRTDTATREIVDFGSNPGNLRMFIYVPKNLPAGRALVVALHGCTQQGPDYGSNAGWVKFADKYRFALLLPQQQIQNNSSQCFRWFDPGQIARNRGEALSIKEMIDRAISDARSDSKRVYITGLSAGGAMTAVMLATYPDIFAGGAIVAGVPYKCAKDVNEALTQCGVSVNPLQTAPIKDLTSVQWGELVRHASAFSGQFPRLSLWQGAADTTVNPLDQRELIDQWSNVLGAAATPAADETINPGTAYPVRHRVYADSSGNTVLETFSIGGMGHGTPIAPGGAAEQCGTVAPYILPVGICSSYWISRFWGIDKQ